MPARKLRIGPTCEKNLRDLSKKHPDISDAVDRILQECTPEGTPLAGKRLSGQGGKPVFIERFRIRNMGKQGGGRLIYYRSDTEVVGLLVFAKRDKGLALPSEVEDALKAAGLLDDVSPVLDNENRLPD